MENAVRDIYSAIYGEVNHRCEKCVEIKGDYWKIAKLFNFCHLKKLVRPETFGPHHVCPSAWKNSASTGRIFMKFDISTFFEDLSRKFKFH
jgi:hypothetical protein